MIGRLKGILVHKQPPWLLVDVGGVGYDLEAPMSTFYDLPEAGREVTLQVHHAVKEDSVSLYGFLTESERRVFRATLEPLEPVSAVGSGDAFLAGFVAARYSGSGNEDSLRFGVACGAESTQHFGAGVVDLREVERLRQEVRVEQIVPSELGSGGGLGGGSARVG